jgi:lipopolysaccharide heptosyltransferase I
VQDAIRRILIIKPSALGDVVHGLPILHGLRSAHPSAHIAWMIRPVWAELLAGHRELDEIIEFDRPYFGRLGRSWRPTRDFVRWIIALARHRFDLVLDLQGLFRSGFFTLASLAPRRYGFARAREFSWLFYNHLVRVDGEAVHAVDRNYRFARPLGFERVEPTFELPMDEATRASARALLADAGADPDAPHAVMAPGSTWGSKRWPADRFARVVDHLRDAHGLGTVLIGSPAECEVGRAVATAARAGAIDLVGRTGIRQGVALIERSAVVVTNDSGPMHIAAALGRPMVAIFGPTDPARTGPYRREDTVVQAVNDRRHHFRHDDDSQIAAVTVEMVLQTLETQLRR